MKKHYLAVKAKYPDAIVLLIENDHVHTFDSDEEQLKKCCYLSSGFQPTLLDYALRNLTKAGHRVAVAQATQ